MARETERSGSTYCYSRVEVVKLMAEPTVDGHKLQ